MKKELQQELFDLAPGWFGRTNPRASLMYFGFEVGDGWYKLLRQLIIDLKPVVSDKFKVVQVKEKFGGLRFYVDGASSVADKLIEEAERKSYTVCEVTGGIGSLHSRGGWVKTISPEYAETNGFEPTSWE